MKIKSYLEYLQEQVYGFPPVKPVQKPKAAKPKQIQPKVPTAPKPPVSPQVTKQKNTPKKNMDQIKNQEPEKKSITAYFNYMLWTTKIIKQGETFRKNCYNDNCAKFEIGTGDRRICKSRCDVETCKKIIAMLKISMQKCSQSNDPQRCKIRYMQLIPLYEKKLNEISTKFIESEKSKKASTTNVG